VLDEIVREAARQMLAVALQAEVSAYISKSRDTPILSPIALPARRRRACSLRDTHIRSR
jgi:hypothetical protein